MSAGLSSRLVSPPIAQRRRHYILESVLERAVKIVVPSAGIGKRAIRHTSRHSLATHLREHCYDTRSGQGLLGHRDVRTTRSTPTSSTGAPAAVRSPADRIFLS